MSEVELWNRVRESIIGRNTFIDTPFGKRLLTYADYTASGRGVSFIEEYFKNDILKLYANTHTDDDLTGEITTERLHISEHMIKECVNAGESYSIIEVGSGATGAINRLQEILGIYIPPATKRRFDQLYNEFLDEGERKRFYDFIMAKRPVVFIGPYEHHSNEISWRECFCEVVEIGLDSGGKLNLDELEKKLQSDAYRDRVKIGSFSAASNVTGIRTPVYEVARLLHRYGAYAFFDFAAAAPYVEIDVNRDEEAYFDAIFFSPHKFLGGPGSCGVLIFKRKLYPFELPPTYSGGGTVDFVNFNTQKYSHAIEVREKPGTPPILQIMRAALALKLKKMLGVKRIEEREEELTHRAFNKLIKIPNLEVLGPASPDNRISIFSFVIKAGDYFLHPRFVIKLMNDLFGIQGRAGCSCAGPYGHRLLGIDDDESSEYYREIVINGNLGLKPGWARVNFHFLFTETEFDFLLRAIEFIAKYGKYFLPLYEFSIKTGRWSFKKQLEGSSDGNRIIEFIRENRLENSYVEDVDFGFERALSYSSRMDREDIPPLENANLEDTKREKLYDSYLASAKEMADKLKELFDESRVKIVGENLIPYGYYSPI